MLQEGVRSLIFFFTGTPTIDNAVKNFETASAEMMEQLEHYGDQGNKVVEHHDQLDKEHAESCDRSKQLRRCNGKST